MATAGEIPSGLSAPSPGQRDGVRPRWLFHAADRIGPLWAFWVKLNNDWVFNLSGLLAYNFLMSLFPILLVVLAVIGFILGAQAPHTLAEIEATLDAVLPGGGQVFQAVSNQLAASAGPLLVVGLGMAAFTGSRLFIVIENCFGIIFGIRGRAFMQQNVMAFGMLLLYLILVPAIAVSSAVPVAIERLMGPLLNARASTTLVDGVALITSSLSTLALFASIYAVVPNRRMRLREVWPGTLVATALMKVYLLVFPIIEHAFLRPQQFGAVVGFAIVILVFFYYMAFILLLGAELNSWMAGRRPMAGDVAAMLHEMRTPRGYRARAEARGPEDLVGESEPQAAVATDESYPRDRQQPLHAMGARLAPRTRQTPGVFGVLNAYSLRVADADTKRSAHPHTYP